MKADGAIQGGDDLLNRRDEAIQEWDETLCDWSRMMEDRWLSVDEIADHLSIKRDTAYKWISERRMPGHKIGRLWKFNKKRSGRVGEVWRSRRQRA
jgi:excisionase family DNA binding protein